MEYIASFNGWKIYLLRHPYYYAKYIARKGKHYRYGETIEELKQLLARLALKVSPSRALPRRKGRAKEEIGHENL